MRRQTSRVMLRSCGFISSDVSVRLSLLFRSRALTEIMNLSVCLCDAKIVSNFYLVFKVEICNYFYTI